MDINCTNNNLNFKALHIANCGNLKLYKITDKSDLNYIKELPQKIKTENLMPNLSKDEYSRWNEILQYAVDNALTPGNTTYLETYNNKPCGIITFFEDKITELDCICTWPIEFGKKVKFAGQTLFYQLFSDFQKIKGGKKIKLEAITNGPYDTVSKYEKLGFQQTDTLPTKVKMETTAPKVKNTLKNLSNTIEYKETNPEKINLYTELEL